MVPARSDAADEPRASSVLLAACMLALFADRRAPVPLLDIALVVLGAVMAFRHQRFLPLAAFVSAPGLLRGCSGGRAGASVTPTPPAVRMMLGLSIAFVILQMPSSRDMATDLRETSPATIVRWMGSHDIEPERPFNTFEDGGYLLFYRRGSQVFIDSRFDLYARAGVFDDHSALRRGESGSPRSSSDIDSTPRSCPLPSGTRTSRRWKRRCPRLGFTLLPFRCRHPPVDTRRRSLKPAGSLRSILDVERLAGVPYAATMQCKNCGRVNPSGSLYLPGTAVSASVSSSRESGRPQALPTPPTGFARANNNSGLRRLLRDTAATQQPRPAAPVPGPCSRCGTQNPPHMRFCNNCGNPLDAGGCCASLPRSSGSAAAAGSGSVAAAQRRAAGLLALSPRPAHAGAEFCKFCGARYSDAASQSGGTRPRRALLPSVRRWPPTHSATARRPPRPRRSSPHHAPSERRWNKVRT